MRGDFPKLYAITDRSLSGLPHAEQVARLCLGGAKLIQLREKESSARDYYLQAKAALSVARSSGARLLINDRVDIALAIGADGVHLGQDDLPVEAARRLLGDDAVIGLSTHSWEQARAAALQPVDYIALGPIFSTTTKANPDPEVGLAGLRKVRELTDLPLIAIGGITRKTIQDVVAAGADSVAIIRDLIADPSDIPERTGQILSML